jgi:hypothetical protein
MSSEDDTIGDLKKLIAAQTGTRAEKIVLKKWYASHVISQLVMRHDFSTGGCPSALNLLLLWC